MRTIFRFLPVLLLTACSGSEVRDTLGLTREAPDEYRVVTRPPLSVPPQFDLRPPASAGEVQDPQAADRQARDLMLGASPESGGNTFKLAPTKDGAPTPVVLHNGKVTAEGNFLQRVGASDANPDIRRAIEQDKALAAQPVEEEDSWWDMFSLSSGKKDPTVNAKKEADRLKKNQEEGKPVTEGATPEVGGKDTGVLGNIFGY